MSKTPLHLRDTAVDRDALHKALVQAQLDGLTPAETADRLASAGFGHAFSYKVKYGPVEPQWGTRNYAIGDLVVKMGKLKRTRGQTQQEVTDIWRAETLSFDINGRERIEARNIRTGRLALYAYAGHFEKVEIDD